MSEAEDEKPGLFNLGISLVARMDEYIPHRIFWCETCKFFTCCVHIHKPKRQRKKKVSGDSAESQS